jgi:hypothetical protein
MRQTGENACCLPRLSRGTRPIRIVHFSDLHSEALVRLEGRLPGIIAGLRPDMIVFTGDALNSREGLPAFRECMTRVAKLAPTFAVRGNFDVWYWRQIDLFGGTGVRELGPDVPAVVQVAGARICLSGVPVGEEDSAEEAIHRAPDDLPTVFLYHYPDLMPQVASLDRVTLYCAGHTHGGQVALPGYGALVTLSRFGKRFEAGRYREGTTWLYVNRGIGMEGGIIPRVRFMSRPEITLIELCPE